MQGATGPRHICVADMEQSEPPESAWTCLPLASVYSTSYMALLHYLSATQLPSLGDDDALGPFHEATIRVNTSTEYILIG